jgi:hypothetical protein
MFGFWSDGLCIRRAVSADSRWLEEPSEVGAVDWPKTALPLSMGLEDCAGAEGGLVLSDEDLASSRASRFCLLLSTVGLDLRFGRCMTVGG